jgi:chemotaxis protein CheY-P-specific phosphatase CheC
MSLQFTQQHADKFGIVFQKGVDYCQKCLEQLSSSKTDFEIKKIFAAPLSDLGTKIADINAPHFIYSSTLNFKGDIFGSIRIIFRQEVLKKIAATYFPDIQNPESEENLKDIITETSNIIGNGLIGTLGNQLNFEITFTPPKFSDLKFQSLYSINTTHSAICTQFTWKSKNTNIPGWVILDFGLGSQYKLMDHLLKE